MKFQTMIQLTRNVVDFSVTLFEKEPHVEKAGSLLYNHKCAKNVASNLSILFCTEEVPALQEGQICSSIRFMEPLTKKCYHNYSV